MHFGLDILTLPTETLRKGRLGWREWVALPELGIERLKCKVDTGARTSALHAFYVETYRKDGVARVKFAIHPLQGRTDRAIECDTPIADQRIVSDSGGHKETRVVVETIVSLGGTSWPIELTLTNRDTMQFRMLLGRTAINGRYLLRR